MRRKYNTGMSNPKPTVKYLLSCRLTILNKLKLYGRVSVIDGSIMWMQIHQSQYHFYKAFLHQVMPSKTVNTADCLLYMVGLNDSSVCASLILFV